MLETTRRPLVCLHYGIGDVVMQLPALDALQARLARVPITLLGAAPALELFQDDGRWQALQAVQDWGLSHWGDPGSEAVKTRIRRWFENMEFDLVLDVSHAVWAVEDVFRSLPVGLLDSNADPFAGRMGGVEAIQEAVRLGWGLSTAAEHRPHIALDPRRRKAADACLQRCRRNGRPLLGLSAVSSSVLKQWPPENLAAAGEALADRFDLQLLVFAGHQHGTAARLVSHLRKERPAIVIEAKHLLDTAALLARCRLLISNDTGLMHMAAAVGTRVVVLFGPTAERIYLPPSAGSRGVSSTVVCPYRKTTSFGPSPCLVQDRCLIAAASCIDSIPPEVVLQTAVEAMTAAEPGGAHDEG